MTPHPETQDDPAPELGPIELVVLQSTSFCNLNCSYCYLSAASRSASTRLPMVATEQIFTKILRSPYLGPGMQVSWHSGEPLVLGTAYYAEAIDRILALKERYCSTDFDLRFDIQTNGTLLTPRWCDLLRRYRNVLTLGVSCDGPAILHDIHRKDWAGRPSCEKTLRGMNLLRENGIPFDLITVVSAQTLLHVHELLQFLRDYKDYVREFHFNLLDELPPATHDTLAQDYEKFLTTILDALEGPRGNEIVRIRNFTSFYRRIFGDAHMARTYDARSMSRPLKTLNVQTNGDVSTFYAGLTSEDCKTLYGDDRGLIIGNLLTQNLEEIAQSSKLRRIASDFEVSHRACEAGCDYYSLCSGGYNLIKQKRFATFAATETPECRLHVKTFADALLNHMARRAPLSDGRPGAVPAPSA